MEITPAVEYGNAPTQAKKSKEYAELEAALLTMKAGTFEKKGMDGDALFVAITELSNSTLSKKLKELTPSDGSFVFKVRKQFGTDKKITGTRVWKFHPKKVEEKVDPATTQASE